MRRILLSLFILSIIASAFASSLTSISSGNWNNPSIWDLGKVPGDGDTVTISAGHSIQYNINNTTTNIHLINIDGTLSFSRSVSTSLTVGTILVRSGGYLDVGNTTSPIQAGIKTDIILYNAPGFNIDNPLISVQPNGKWTVHGAPMKYTWTFMSSDSHANERILNVEDPIDWNTGDTIVIGSSDRNQTHFEVKPITSVSGNQIIIPTNLAFEHTGTYPEKTEIINIDRNVVIRSGNTTTGNGTARAHTIFLEGAVADIRFARFDQLGPRILGEYPIHFHIGKTSLINSVVYGNSITNSDNRCLTIHSTVGINVTNNVAFNASGHCYFLEIGDETGNTLDHNVGIYNRPGSLLLTDTTSFNGPTIFWIQNGNNTITNDIASSGARQGFWYNIQQDPIVFFDGVSRKITATPVTKFENNSAHSNIDNGLFVEFLFPLASYNPTGGEFANNIMWRNGARGEWIRISSGNFTIRNETIFGNPIGSTIPAQTIKFQDSIIMGELDRVFANNRQSTYVPGVFGYVFYDTGRINVTNVIIKNHFDTQNQNAGDIGFLDGENSLDPDTLVKNSFLLSPRPVYLNTSKRFGMPGAIIQVQNNTGIQDSCLAATISVYDPDNCSFNSTLNLYVCANICNSLKTVFFTHRMVNNPYYLFDTVFIRKDINNIRIYNDTSYNANQSKKAIGSARLLGNKTYDIIFMMKNGTINPVTNVTLVNYFINFSQIKSPFTNYTEFVNYSLNKTTFNITGLSVKKISVTAPKKPVNVTYGPINLTEGSVDTDLNNTWYYNSTAKTVIININR